MNTAEIRQLVMQKSGQPPLHHRAESLVQLEDLSGNPDVQEYLQDCLANEIYLASGIRVLPLNHIVAEMGEAAAPGSFIRPFGYIVVGTSIGGNAVCFHSPSGRVVWADHSSLTEYLITFKDRDTGEWDELFDYTPENVSKALVPLSENIESFLRDFLTDQLTNRLAALD